MKPIRDKDKIVEGIVYAPDVVHLPNRFTR